MRWPLVFVCVLLATSYGQKTATPEPDKISDSETAVRVAEKALIPVYGKKVIYSEKPFQATLQDGVWTVFGTLRCADEDGREAKNCVGGVARVRIRKRDGHILSMGHTE